MGWIIIGLIAGFLAHKVFGAGTGSILSALIVAGFALGSFSPGTVGILGTIVVASIGVLILKLILRAITGRRAHQ